MLIRIKWIKIFSSVPSFHPPAIMRLKAISFINLDLMVFIQEIKYLEEKREHMS